MFDKGNWDFDHNKSYRKTRKIIAYGSLKDRKNFPSCLWAFDRKQHNSSTARKIYLRSCNKHTRQLLKEEVKKEVNEMVEL
jgi:hypothetical protein